MEVKSFYAFKSEIVGLPSGRQNFEEEKTLVTILYTLRKVPEEPKIALKNVNTLFTSNEDVLENLKHDYGIKNMNVWLNDFSKGFYAMKLKQNFLCSLGIHWCCVQ